MKVGYLLFPSALNRNCFTGSFEKPGNWDVLKRHNYSCDDLRLLHSYLRL